MLRAFLLVALGGGLGSAARYGIGVLMGKWINHPYPFATFLINISGCFIIGLLYGLVQKQDMSQTGLWLLAATGFCGGFTTFSSFALENINLLNDNKSMIALLYVVLSLIVGLLLCKAGIYLSR